MRKKFFIAFILALALFGLSGCKSQPETETNVSTPPASEETAVFDPQNCTYTIEGERVALVNGSAEEAAATGTASKVTTRYFGNKVLGDFNEDGYTDDAFLLTQDRGGSGTFYYLVAALKTENGCQGTNAVLLGDRIAPQTTEYRNGEIIVNYAERAPGEPMTAAPSIGVSKYLKVDGNSLVEVEE